jgi:hypothetical protein
MDEFNKELRNEKPFKRRRCGPFKLSELPSAAIKLLIEKGQIS